MEYVKAKRRINLKNKIKNLIFLTIGCIIMAIGTSLFLLPNQLSTGGFSGISTIIYYLFEIPLGITMLILNIPFLIWAAVKVGKKLLIKSILGTILLTIFIDIFERFPPLTEDRFLACIYGGIFIGLGIAGVLKANASTGGTDLISYIAKAYNPYIKTSSLIMLIDTIIIILNVIFFREIEIGLYSAISIYIMGKMIDVIFEGVNFTKMMLIISNENEKISDEISKQLQRGSTGIYAKGMYTKEEKKILMCVGTIHEISKIKKIATDLDRKAFIIIVNARETWGKGFKGISN